MDVIVINNVEVSLPANGGNILVPIKSKVGNNYYDLRNSCNSSNNKRTTPHLGGSSFIVRSISHQ